jgi:hypothetical protein
MFLRRVEVGVAGNVDRQQHRRVRLRHERTARQVRIGLQRLVCA